MMLFYQKADYKATTFKDLFISYIKTNKFALPEYQRTFEWPQKEKENRVEVFVEDFLSMAKHKGQQNLLGNFVFLNDSNGTLKIIDGAQRLSTIFCFILAVERLILDLVTEEFFSAEQREESIDTTRFFKSVLKTRNTEFYLTSKRNFDISIEKIYTLLKKELIELKFATENISSINRLNLLPTANTNNKALRRYLQELVDAVCNSHLNFIITTDEATARNYFKILNTGKQIKAYELMKLAIDNAGNGNAISQFSSMFSNGKEEGLKLLALCLSSRLSNIQSNDTGQIISSTELETLILNSTFADLFANTNNLLLDSQKTINHINSTLSWINTNLDSSLIFTSNYTKQLIGLMQHDLEFQKNKESAIILLILVEALNNRPFSGGGNKSGSIWNNVISSYRKDLRNTPSQAFSKLKINLLSLYLKEFQLIVKNAISSSYDSKKANKIRLWLWLLEIYFNNKRLPIVNTYSIEHINAYNGTKKDNTINNLCLLESSINSSLGSNSLIQKQQGYLKSALKYPKYIATASFSTQNISPNLAQPTENPYYNEIWNLFDLAICDLLQ